MVDPELFPMLFKEGQCFLVTGGIPEGAQFRGFGLDGNRNVICCLVEHPSFEETPSSEEYPKHKLECKRIYHWDEDRNRPETE